jgi:hypothetical protein
MTGDEGKLMTELRSVGRSGTPLLPQAVITDGEWHRIPRQTKLRGRRFVDLPAPIVLGCHSPFFAECIEYYAGPIFLGTLRNAAINCTVMRRDLSKNKVCGVKTETRCHLVFAVFFSSGKRWLFKEF